MRNAFFKSGNVCKMFFCTVPLLSLVNCENVVAQRKSLPNIIYILADDMGYGDIRALNQNSRIPTPHLDRMISQGRTFTDAHSNSAVSTPTRYGTLTGRYAFRSRLKSGVLVGYDPPLIEQNRETVASFLKKNGYRTACIGKWHLGLDWAKKDSTKALYEGSPWDTRATDNVDYAAKIKGGPNDCGFDYSLIMPASLDIAPYVYIENGKVTAPVTRHAENWKSDEARGMWYRHGDIAEDFSHENCLQRFTEQSVKFINSTANSSEPFFLYFPLTAPHTPWLPSKEFKGRSQAGVYGDFVCMVDDVVRQIYEALEKTGQTENTLVIFTSDNGSHWLESDIKQTGHSANGIYSGMKSDIWEGGHRVPYIVTWPSVVKAGTTSQQVVCSTDLMATCADIVGKNLPPQAGEDSFSFLKALTDQSFGKLPARESIIYHSIEGYFGFRQGEWVLLDCKGSGGWSLPEDKAKELSKMQLYNLKNDPQEKKNLSESNVKRVKKMKLQMDKIVTSSNSH
ncbi:MAG: sulfatase family protein [Macellibacteroides fermentans]|uniref:sulfatase family protein n=1 Tax=Macellibacteroides fermentans TaxID=879969 RepID=UPI003AC4185D